MRTIKFGVIGTGNRSGLACLAHRPEEGWVLGAAADPSEKRLKRFAENYPEAKTFTDADQISDFAIEAVAAMSAAGIINGTPEGAFLPGGDATRAQTAKMVSVLDSYK